MTNKTSKHERVYCESCHTTFECKANSSTYCQCTQVELNHEEAEYISECFDSCLCAGCLDKLKKEYNEHKLTTKSNII